MAKAGIAEKANFDIIRYAQLWEDADILVEALKGEAGRSFLSVCSAGDNVLAMLLLDPKRVVACDLSQAQLHCLRIRIAAMKFLEWEDFRKLMDSGRSPERRAIMTRVLSRCSTNMQNFWFPRMDDIERHGLGGVGKFERYFRVFRRFVLPLIHGSGTVRDVFTDRIEREEREEFFERRWNTWRWRLATDLFFSKFMMGRLGRDPAFFAHVQGSLPAHVRLKVRDAAVEQRPWFNPYMQWILLGRHSTALPLARRKDNYETIRSRLDRIEIHHGPVDDESLGKFDGFNLSDVFEYMSLDEFEQSYWRLVTMANPGARLVYWNMMAHRRVPDVHAFAVRRMRDVESELGPQDKAFFYRDFVVEEVI